MVPCVNFAEHVLPQLMVPLLPAGVPVTVPLPPRPMESANCGVKVAVTFCSAFTVTVQVSCVPTQSPVQPLKTPPPGLAVRVTTLPCVNVVVQDPPQLILPLAPV